MVSGSPQLLGPHKVRGKARATIHRSVGTRSIAEDSQRQPHRMRGCVPPSWMAKRLGMP